MFRYIFIITGLMGLILLAAGAAMRIYTVKSDFFVWRKNLSAANIVNSRWFNKISGMLIGNENGFFYKAGSKILKKADVEVGVKMLYFYKLVSIVVILTLAVSIRFTNAGVLENSIISRSGQDIGFFETGRTEDYKHNMELYRVVLKRIGEKNLKRLDEEGRLAAIRTALKEQAIQGDEGSFYTEHEEAVDSKAGAILRAFNGVSGIRIFGIEFVIVFLAALFLPEGILVARGLLRGSKYRQEVIKLENIFELLGSIRGFKTIYILKEMGSASSTLEKRFKKAMGMFQSDREEALEYLKVSVQSKRFSKLVDIIRVYSLVDKNLAMSILERNMLEKEEEMLITAQEDIDLIDIVAFISITPIIFELGNLLMKPMMDLIFQVFTVI